MKIKPTTKIPRQRLSLPGFLIVIILSLINSGCVTLSDPETSQVNHEQTVYIGAPEQTIGQSFVSRRPHLNSITIWLNPESNVGDLTVALFNTPQDSEPLLSKKISVTSLIPNQGFHFEFQPIGKSPNTKYYLEIHSLNTNFSVLGRISDQYADGNLFINREPMQGDIAFETTYDYDLNAFLQDINNDLKLWRILLLTILLTFVPGWLLLTITGLDRTFSPGENVAISFGVSLAIIPILMLWTTVFSIKWTRPIVLIGGTILGVLLIVRLLSRFKFFRGGLLLSAKQTRKDLYQEILPLLIIFSITLFIRLAMTRDLVAPAWVDSIHHALLTKLILNQGGIPPSFAPYLPIEASNYHIGFHANLSVFIWLTNLTLPSALLFFGQFLNALVIFSTYLFTKTLFHKTNIALIAALVTGIFTPMPAYFASWGRYTQLAGLVIFPIPIAFLSVYITRFEKFSTKEKIKLLIISALVISGLLLTHYRVLVFLIVFMIWYFIIFSKPKTRWQSVLGLLIVSLVSILLSLPSLYSAIRLLIIPKIHAWGGGTQVMFNGFSWRFLNAGWGKYTLATASLGILWTLIRKWKIVFIIGLWVGTLFFLANLKAIGVQFPDFINNLSIEISLFIIISAFSGYFVIQSYDFIRSFTSKRIRSFLPWIALSGLCATSIFGAQKILPLLNPVTFLARETDFEAMDWIKENISANESFLINPSEWGYGLYMGSDGGYWISPITGNPTFPPPVIYGLGSKEYTQKINRDVKYVLENAENPKNILDFLNENSINYIYLGGKGGILQPSTFEESQSFKTIFSQKGIWIFKKNKE